MRRVIWPLRVLIAFSLGIPVRIIRRVLRRPPRIWQGALTNAVRMSGRWRFALWGDTFQTPFALHYELELKTLTFSN
jgi:hypothetical protein